METLHILINQIVILAIVVVGGYIAGKRDILKEEDRFALMRLIINITLPLLIFTTFAKMRMDIALLQNSLFSIAISISSMLIVIGIAYKIFRLFKVEASRAVIPALHSAFGNIVFLGFPLCNALVPGGRGLFFAAIFHLSTDALLWTLGIYLLSRYGKGEKESFIKHFINPNTTAFALGIIAMSFGLKVPVVIDTALAGVGHTTIYLSMLYIGLLIAKLHPANILKYKLIWPISFNKLILMPTVVYLIYLITIKLFHFKADSDALLIVFVQSSMPGMATLAVLAKKFGFDDSEPALNTVLTMIFSILTMPLVLFVLQKLF